MLVDPDIARELAALPPLPGQGPLTSETLRVMRARQDALRRGTLSDAVERSDHVIDHATGVTVRVHRPRELVGPLPCLFWIHGGGYVSGSSADEDLRFDRWCPALGLVGASIDYRLAPESPYPAALNDCHTGLRWVHDHAADLGIDKRRIGIAGTSAGGGLCAALSLLVRDRGWLQPLFQLLLYPMLDDRSITASSRWEHVPIWDASANEFAWRCYLGSVYGSGDVPVHAAPARADDLHDLPPTLVCVGGLDIFVDEDVDYALRLNRQGVPTELRLYPGAPHAFDAFFEADIARRCRREVRDWVVRQLDVGAAPHGAE